MQYLFGRGPVLFFNGQEVGEPGLGAEGFSSGDGRTTAFDYWCMPEFAKWVNGHAYDGGGLSEAQRALRGYYADLLALRGYNSDPLLVKVLPAAGAVQGFGAFFRTSLQLFNASNAAMTGKLVFHKAGQSAADSDPSLAFTIAPRPLLSLSNAAATSSGVLQTMCLGVGAP